MDGAPVPGPLGIGDLLDRAFRLFRARLWRLLLATALFLVPLGLLSGLLMGQFATSYFDLLGAGASRRASNVEMEQVVAGTVGFYGLAALLALLAVPVGGLATLTVTDLANEALHGRPGALGAGARRGLRRLPAYVGMVFLQGLAIIGASLLVLIPFVIVVGLIIAAFALTGAADRPNPVAVAGIIILAMLAYLTLLALLALPAVYLLTRWLVAVPALLVEGIGPVSALGRSWRLTKRNVWRCLGFNALLFILGLLIAGLPLLIVQQALIVLAGPTNLGWLAGFSSGIGQIGNVLWLPLQMTATLVLYYDLRVRQESYDLALRVEQLERQAATIAAAEGAGTPAVPSPDQSMVEG
jgi:hypothetical protein